MPSSVQPSEITAMIVAVPVFLLWVHNLRVAIKGLRVVRRMTDEGDAMLIQARLAVFDPFTLAVVQFVIIAVVGMLMTFNPNPDSTVLSRWFIAGGMIFVSVLIGLMALFRRIADDRTMTSVRGDTRMSQKNWSDWSGAE